jgi:hypothetical protein
MGPLASSIG